jgi:hypothetical protein
MRLHLEDGATISGDSDVDDSKMDDPEVMGMPLPPPPPPPLSHHFPHIGSQYSPFTANESRDLRKYGNRGHTIQQYDKGGPGV